MDELIRELRKVEWIKSTHSGSNGGNCVEIARLSGSHRGVRDSKSPFGPILMCNGPAWNAFIRGLKHGLIEDGVRRRSE
ncbi:DUF397 domain-containing protein [Sphaerisporangium rhizosphaerae]|uniref:DUF397 domain-containing protein n=1 Tax=Sphaerisporangium rhizosphaerae TaxID=2269375 RepID=A0ABW2NU87_9ACTN